MIVQTIDGRIHEVRDDRLAQAAAPQKQQYRQAIRRDGAFGHDHPAEWRTLVAAQTAARNSPHGYWIAEADPEAARHAVHRQWPATHVALALVMTDGVSDGVDEYGIPHDWHHALALAWPDPGVLVDLVHEAEDTDPEGTRWPRSKQHDDKAAAVIRFSEAD